MEKKNVSKISKVFKLITGEILTNIKTKWIGFFVGLGAWVLTIIQLISYNGIVDELFAEGVIIFSVLGILAFVVFSLFRQTSSLAVIFLMVCNFMCFISFASAGGMVDYFATQFFDGFSFEKIFDLPVSVWFSILMFILSFVCASVAMYLPQNRKVKDTGINPENTCEKNNVVANHGSADEAAV